VPSLDALDRLASRVVLVGLGLLTAGIAVGLARLGSDDVDLTVAVTVLIWGVYAAALLLRLQGLVQGRRLAWLYVLGFGLVGVVLPLTHFAS
jgi:ABC-type transport system involved in cytochrome c biogenesis permease subunit